MISSDIFEYPHEFLRGAYFSAGVSLSGADASNDRLGFGIIKMSEVPSQKIVDIMHGGYCNMQSIIQRLGPKGSPLEKSLGQPHHSLRDWKYGHTG